MAAVTAVQRLLLWRITLVNGLLFSLTTIDGSLYLVKTYACCPLAVLSCLVLCRFAVGLRAHTAWLIVEGPPAANLAYEGLTKTVLLSSPNHSHVATFIKGK